MTTAIETPPPHPRDRYAIIGSDGELITYARSIRQAQRSARVILGSCRLSHGPRGWLHASRAEGCASVQVLPIARRITLQG